MLQLKVQNFYSTTATSDIISTGDTSFTVAVPPTYTSGFLVISPNNSALREIVYFHNVVGNTISVRAENRGQGGTTARLHTSTETVAINDVAEIFNMFSDSISQCFFVEKTGGLNVRVWGGTVFYNGNPVTVADTTIALTDNQTNYIKYSYPTNTISADTVNSGNIKARVIVASGVITSIQYYVAKESYIDFTVAITGALPSQAGNAGKFLQTDGSIVSWQEPLPVQTGNAGKLLGTNGSVTSWSEQGIVGEMKIWPATSLPTGSWLFCNGSAISRTTYAGLFAVIGTLYGIGDGSTTFNLPSALGRSLVGRKDATSIGTTTMTIASPCVVTRASHGLSNGQQVYFTTTGALPTGLTASTSYFIVNATTSTFNVALTLGGTAINTSGSQSGTHTLFSVDFDTLGKTGGEANHLLTSNEMPSHRHRFKAPGGSGGSSYGGFTIENANAASGSYGDTVGSFPEIAIENTGGSTNHNNLSPYLTINYIIRY